MHRAKKEPHQPILVHYTDLRKSRVHLNGRRGFGAYRCVQGPAVLIPRVGLITPDKVAILGDKKRVMISDCVIALKTGSQATADAVRLRIVANFSDLRARYVGTGAPFITLERLNTALGVMGIDTDA